MLHFIVPIKDKTIAEKYLLPSLQSIVKLKNVILADGDAGICLKYNQVLETLIHSNKLNDDDVVVFCHDDIIIRDEYIIEKAEMYFKHKPNIGIAGVIGTTVHPEAGGWWMVDRTQHTRGSIIQGAPNKESYEMNDRPGMYDDLVTVDGCIMFMSGKVAKWFRFDAETFKGYHQYDSSACFQLLSQGWNIGTINIKVEHISEGELTNNWAEQKDIFVSKWGYLGWPVTISSFKR